MASLADEKLVNSPNARAAAAEVGKIDWSDIDAARAVATEATIERCAQAAENCELNDIDRDSPGTAIAAAIRALKDQS